jgi:hypothetical protein
MGNDKDLWRATVKQRHSDAQLKEFFGTHYTAYAIIVYRPGSVQFDALTPLMPTEDSAWQYASIAARAALRKEARGNS